MIDLIIPKDYISPDVSYDDPKLQQMADALDDDVVAQIKIAVHRNGAMSVAGCIDEEMFAIACLQQAIQTVKDHNMRRRMAKIHSNQIDLVVPHYDTPLRG